MNRSFKNKKLVFPAGRVGPVQIDKVHKEINMFVAENKKLGPFERHKPHLLLPSIYELSQNKIITDAVNSFLGANSFLWYSVFFIKKKSSEEYIPWHYDDYFWSITGKNGCTVWIAIDDVTDDMGPMEFCFDSISNYSHQTETNPNNMLARGNTSDFQPSRNSVVEKVCLKKENFRFIPTKCGIEVGPIEVRRIG